MIGHFIHWLIETISALGYPGIVLLMAIESSVLPLPSELIMPPAGYLAARGEMNGVLAILAGTAGSVLGALINYFLAATVGEPVREQYGTDARMAPRYKRYAHSFQTGFGERRTAKEETGFVSHSACCTPCGFSPWAEFHGEIGFIKEVLRENQYFEPDDGGGCPQCGVVSRNEHTGQCPRTRAARASTEAR